MAEFVFSAFADEAGVELDEQIKALLDNGIRYLEPRFIGGKGILDLTDEELYEVKARLDECGIKVNSLGSPIGKYPITEPFEIHFEKFKRALEVAKILDTKNIRMFSFYIPEGEPARNYSDEVVRRMTLMVEEAARHGIRLNHENESKIFGQNPEEVSYLLDNIDGLYGVFDAANYRNHNCDVIAGIEATLKRFGYMHIKDAIYEPNMIVPAGEGEGRIAEVIDIINKNVDGEVVLTLEPHLHIFKAFKEIDTHELKNKYVFNTNREAFDFATKALEALLTSSGYRKVDGYRWIK